MTGTAIPQVECVEDVKRAAALMQPLRMEILRRAEEPISASQIASQLSMPRQKVNYHVRALAQAGFLLKAGRRLKRNLVEQRYRATARSYLLAPQLLGPLAASPGEVQDRFSAEYLLALTSSAQQDLSRALSESSQQGKRLATLSIASEIRFESPQQRAGFAEALQKAIVDVIAAHTSPPDGAGEEGAGRSFRLLLGCYPTPAAHPAPDSKTDGSSTSENPSPQGGRKE